MANPTAAQKAALNDLLDKFGPEIRDAFLKGVYRARSRADVGAIIAALEARDVERAADQLRLEQADFSALKEAMRAAYMAGGESAGDALPAAIAAKWGFDGQNSRAQAWISARSSDLIEGIVEDTKQAVRAALGAVLESPLDRSLRSAALDITGRVNTATGLREGGILGLTSAQTDWVLNAEQDLRTLDVRYFTRAQRDKRFDALVRKAIAAGTPLPEADIRRIMGRYKDKLLAYRGKVISEHETFEAQAEAREEAMRQVYERDDVEDVTRKWQLGFPREHRANHVALAGTRISFSERFDLGNGLTCRCPHDSDLPASEVLNCRCSVVYRVKLKPGI